MFWFGEVQGFFVEGLRGRLCVCCGGVDLGRRYGDFFWTRSRCQGKRCDSSVLGF